MKKLIYALTIGTLVALYSTMAMSAETTLRITLQLPLKSHLGQNLVLFKQEVEKN